MKKSDLRLSVSAIVAATVTVQPSPLLAGDAGARLDEIVVTAATGNRSRLQSAISVTAVDARHIEDFGPTSEAELFRLLPGIQVAGTTGPGGNSNIAVRGLPVATGGAPFVQIQEDGLPTVLFGDIIFGNNDYWTRFDATVARVEAVRGGTVTTFASQAPGAVINYVSHDGADEGGHVQLETGVGHNLQRIDFRKGGSLGDGLRYHVGGFYRRGRGPLHADYRLSDSVQLKGNVTRSFTDGNGWVRVLVKYAHTREPYYNGAPVTATLAGNRVTDLRPFPGFDGRSQSNYSTLNRSFLILNREGALERVGMTGITTRAFALQGQLHRDLGERITLDNNIRWTRMSGAFTAPFFTPARTDSLIGTLVNGGVVDEVRYANGPQAGTPYGETFYNRNTNVRTNMRDVGSFANDLALTGRVDTAAGLLTARAGLFYMKQKLEMDWHPNHVLSAISGDNPAMLDLYDAAGNRLTANGIAGLNTNWGPCCARDYDLAYANRALHGGLELETGAFVLDGSVRLERVHASGRAARGEESGLTVPVAFDGSVTSIAAMVPGAISETLDYRRGYTSWTAGGLWKASSDLSVFVRASHGGRFNGDRQTLSGKIDADGSLNTAGRIASVDFVRQYELGVKARGAAVGGSYSVELTLLRGSFSRSDYEPTQTLQCPNGGCVLNTRYRSHGAELFATYRTGSFGLVAAATYTKAKRALAGGGTFHRADGLPDLSYTVSATQDIDDRVTIGLSATGQTKVSDATGIVYPGKTICNGVIRVRPLRDVELGLKVYNLFDTLDLRGAGSSIDTSAVPAIVSGNMVLGRTWTASARYSF